MDFDSQVMKPPESQNHLAVLEVPPDEADSITLFSDSLRSGAVLGVMMESLIYTAGLVHLQMSSTSIHLWKDPLLGVSCVKEPEY